MKYLRLRRRSLNFTGFAPFIAAPTGLRIGIGDEIPGRGIVIDPYRVCFTITRPQADTANKQDATRSTHIALTVDQIPYIAPFDTSS